MSEALDDLKAWADRLGALLPGMGGPSTDDITKMSPEEYTQYRADLAGAQTRAKPKMRRLIGNVAKSVQSVDPDTGEVNFFAKNPMKMTRPEIADELIAMPAWLGESLGYDMSNWPQSQRAMQNTEAVEGAMREGMDYPPPSNTEEYMLEAAGSMLGQLPVPEGSFAKLKAPFRVAGQAARNRLGPVIGRAAQATTLAPRAGIEFFGPMVEPSLQNYGMGTGFGTGLSYLRDPNQDEFEAMKWKLAHGEIDPNEAIQKLRELNSRAEPEGHAKGGKIDLMSLRKSIEGMLREAPEIQGSGKEMVPVQPTEASLPSIPGDVPTLEDLKQMAAEAAPAPEPQQITDMPVSRRTFLKGAVRSAGALMSPVKLDLGSLLTPSSDILGLGKLGASAMEKFPFGVIARLNDGEGYERSAWGESIPASRRALVNKLAEGIKEGKAEFEDLDQLHGTFREFGVNHTAGTVKDIGDWDDPFENLMATVRGHGFTRDEEMPAALARELDDPDATRNLRDVAWTKRMMEKYAESTGVPYEQVKARVLAQTEKEAKNNMWATGDNADPKYTRETEEAMKHILDHGLLEDRQEYMPEDLWNAYPHLSPGEIFDLHDLIGDAEIPALGKPALAKILNDLHSGTIHSSDEDALLELADHADKKLGTTAPEVGEFMRNWHHAITQPKELPEEELVKWNENFEKVLGDIAHENGLVHIPSRTEPVADVENGPKFDSIHYTEPEFAEPPEGGSNILDELIRNNEFITHSEDGTPRERKIVRELKALKGYLGDRADLAFSQNHMTEEPSPLLVEAFKHLKTSEDTQMELFHRGESYYGDQGDLEAWARAKPELREEYRQLKAKISAMDPTYNVTPEEKKIQKRIHEIWREIFPDYYDGTRFDRTDPHESGVE